MKLYLAGPMRGYTLYNFPAFFSAAMLLRQQGHQVSNPAEKDMAVGLNPSERLDHADNAYFSLEEAFKWDLHAIMRAEAIVLMPGWRESKGAQAELVLAVALQRKVFELIHDSALAPLDIKSYNVDFFTEIV